jgi:prepilin-type N-terminal cleavage/methylation domain-containing protein
MNEKKTDIRKCRLRNGKRGFTLVELCVVLFLIVLLSAMTVSFSALVGKQSKTLQSEYTFMEQCSLLRADVTDWLYDNVTVDSGFAIYGGTLSIGGNTYTQSYSEIRDVSFTANDAGNMLKCTATSESGAELTFVIAVRTAMRKHGGGE